MNFYSFGIEVDSLGIVLRFVSLVALLFIFKGCAVIFYVHYLFLINYILLAYVTHLYYMEFSRIVLSLINSENQNSCSKGEKRSL